MVSGSRMKPVFISYSSKHRDLTRGLASLIEAQYGAGSVWCDHELESRASYAVQIKAALEQARVIVVIWTAGAMVSDYVYAEAVVAQAQGKLVNVRPADMSFRDIPEPFNIHHIDEAEDHRRILTTIAKVMNGTPIPTRVPLHEIYFRQHGQRLIDPKHKALAPDPREISPTELLQAKFGVVPYRDVTGMAVDLLGWCIDGSRQIAGRLVHGQGGLGKTRLLIEVAATLRERGWIAGFLDRPHERVEVTLKQRWQALDQLIDCGDDSGLLIVMDYGESRQDEVTRLAQRLADCTADTRPIRLVLLTRSAGDWWTRLVDEQPELERVFRGRGGHPDIIALPGIAAGQQRLELFAASRRAFASVLAAHGYVAPTGEPRPERLRRIDNDAGYARPLAVQMEALLWLASAAPETSATGVDVLLRRVLGLEREHWKKLLGALDEERTRDVERGVAQITVVQGVPSRASAEQLLMADGFYGDERRARVAVDSVVRNLSRVYGTADGGIAHLEPDLIGEHHVATVADTELLDGCLSWIEADPGEVRAKRRRGW